MEEDVENQELLREEQLEVITGGCDKCWELLAAANTHLEKAKIAKSNADRAIRDGNTALAITHREIGQKSLDNVINLHREVGDLRAQPGHVLTPAPEWYKKR